MINCTNYSNKGKYFSINKFVFLLKIKETPEYILYSKIIKRKIKI